MDKIESALASANNGSMRDLTDLTRETIDVDPHLGAVLNKRFRALAALPWEVHPASGAGVDKGKALLYAAVAREQILALSGFRQFLVQQAWALFDGRAVHELMWARAQDTATIERKEVAWAVTDMEWVHPRRIHFGPSRELRITNEGDYVSGTFPSVGLAIDETDLRRAGLWRKFAWWTPQLFGESAEREGLARRCLYWSFFKRFAQRERMILMELYGKPWRILEVPEESSASDIDLTSADDIVDALGASSTARLPRGTKLNITAPDRGAGGIHQDVVTEADKQISKLVLGQTGTTDAVPAGLNSNSASILRDEQLMLLQGDAHDLSAVVQHYLTDAIIEINFGASALGHAPTFILRYDQPADRGIEIDRTQAALNMGLEVPLSDAYASAGIRQPEDDEARIRVEQPPTTPLSPVAPAPRAVIIWPKGLSPSAGEQQPPAPAAGTDEGSAPSAAGAVSAPDQASVVTINEARAAQGLPPLTLPDGSPDPDGALTVEVYRSRHAGEPPPMEGAPVVEAVAKRSIDLLLARGITEMAGCWTPEIAGDLIARVPQSMRLVSTSVSNARLAASEPLPTSRIGDPNRLIDRQVRELDRALSAWAKDVSESVGNATRPAEIYRLTTQAVEDLDLFPFARVIERALVRGAMLGALDNADEVGMLGTKLEIPRSNESTQLLADAAPPVVTDGDYEDAVRAFKARKVLPRAAFERLDAAARRRAFTVAGVTSQDMLGVIHSELVRQVAAGADLTGFQRWMTESLKSAGFMASRDPSSGVLTASHLETVARTNAANAYGAGRATHQTLPAVMRARPVWEYRAIGDDRSRATHLAANGSRRLASDPIWQTVYPPTGMCCRCRILTLGPDAISTVTSSAALSALPDPGFVSGIPSLL